MPSVPIDDTVRLETPEGVFVSAVLADPLSRAAALLIDMLLMAVLLFLLAFVFMNLPSWHTGLGLFMAAAFLLIWGYFFLCEWLWQGQTPGKRAMGLQVVGTDLLPIGAAQAAWRNVLRYLDFLPFAFALGAVVMLINGKNRRLGDWMAGTVVIFHNPPARKQPPLQPGEVLMPPWHLSREDQRTLVEFARYADMHHEERLIELSAPLAAKMPEYDDRARVRHLRAWGRWIAGMTPP